MNTLHSNIDCADTHKGISPRSTIMTAGIWIFGALLYAAIASITGTPAAAFTDSVPVDCSPGDTTCGIDPNDPLRGYLGDTDTLPPEADSIDVAPAVQWGGGKPQGEKCIKVEGCMNEVLRKELFCQQKSMEVFVVTFTYDKVPVKGPDGKQEKDENGKPKFELVLNGMNWKCYSP